MNTYRGLAYTCDGTESALADHECTRRGSICTTDSAEHAVAISCGGSSGTVVKAAWCMILNYKKLYTAKVNE